MTDTKREIQKLKERQKHREKKREREIETSKVRGRYLNRETDI